MSRANALVAQSGGPSPVINASLQGVVEACLAADGIGTVYGARHGIEGVLLEELADLGAEPGEELRRLSQTPASGVLGSCRYKLGAGHQADFQRILDVFRAHDIRYFFYIGGNDSMDTAHKVNLLAQRQGYELFVMGVPKTIDNDLGDEARTLIDHTPGYGSCARYWAQLIRDVDQESRAMCPSECVSVLQAMGRSAGFIPAAARLGDPERRMPLRLFLPEAHPTAETLFAGVDDTLRRSGRCIVVISESFMTNPDAALRDGFGHVEYGASRTTAMQDVVNALNARGFPVRGQATGQVPGVFQRSCSVQASPVDRREAYRLGELAVEYALSGITGRMTTVLRVCDAPYAVRYDHVSLSDMANSARCLPAAWLAAGQDDVTDDFLRYGTPLLGDGPAYTEFEGGLQRFARLRLDPVPKRLPAYVPVSFSSTANTI